MFKRLVLCGAVSCCLMSSAMAGMMSYKGEMMPVSMFRPYVGLNYVYLHNSYEGSVTESIGGTSFTFDPGAAYHDDFSGLSADAGFKYGNYVGMEFGYYQTGKRSRTNGATTTSIRPKGGYIDLRGYYPINNWDIIGIAGFVISSLGDAHVTTSTGTTTLQSDDSVTPRLGVGLAYNINDCWGVRATAKYSFSESRYIDHVTSFDAGVYYNFPA